MFGPKADLLIRDLNKTILRDWWPANIPARVAHIARQMLGFYRDTSAPIRFGVVKAIDDLLFLYEKRFESRNIRVIKQYKDNSEITALAERFGRRFQI